MKFVKLATWFAVLFSLILPTFCAAQDNPDGNGLPFGDDLTTVALGPARTHGNLTIYPLVAAKQKGRFGFLSLDKAMNGRKLRVTEWGSGNVPKLKVKNKADKKTFIMAGEIVTGAKQDRMSAHDVLLEEKSKEVAMPVYCVEQGRWAMNSQEFASGGTAGTKTLRKSAVQKKSQGKIWSDVAEKSAKSGVNSSTGTMQAVYSNKKMKRQIKAYEKAFVDLPKTTPGMLGFVAVVGGEVSSVDLFGDTELLGGVWKKLLKAIAVDAVTETVGTGPNVTQEGVRGFLSEGFFGDYKNIENPGLGKEFMIEGKSGVAGSTLVYNKRIVHMALFSADSDEKPRTLRSNTPRIQAEPQQVQTNSSGSKSLKVKGSSKAPKSSREYKKEKQRLPEAQQQSIQLDNKPKK